MQAVAGAGGLVEPVGIFLSGERFVLRNGEENGADFVVAGDGDGAVGGDFSAVRGSCALGPKRWGARGR